MSNGSMPNATQLLYLLLLFTKHSIVYTFHCDSKCLYSSILKGKMYPLSDCFEKPIMISMKVF